MPAMSGAFGVATVITLLVYRGILPQLTSHLFVLRMSLTDLSIFEYTTTLPPSEIFMKD